MAEDRNNRMAIFVVVILCCFSLALGATDAGDEQVLMDFRKGLSNPELLQWPAAGDPCGPPRWNHIFCDGPRVTQIQIQNMGLGGTLPPNFNKLSRLFNIGFQKNNFSGKLPTFSGLSELQYAYLGNNQFDTIPADFFDGLRSLRVLSLDYSPLNKTGWSLPPTLQDSPQLMNLSLIGTNLVGPLPDFLGGMVSLTALKLSYNSLSGKIPSSYQGSELQILWLNNQLGSTKLTGLIDVVASMPSIRQLWLHGNQFTGTIPVEIENCSALTDLRLNDNELVGPIPNGVTKLPLQILALDNNKLTGSIPKVVFENYTFAGNLFCQSSPGTPCAPQVTALLDFLGSVDYPLTLSATWSGNDPCTSSWTGVSCNNNTVSIINLPNFGLNGTLSPSIGKLDSLKRLLLEGNNLIGMIPEELASLQSLEVVNLTGNNMEPPIPKFGPSVKLLIDGNPKLQNGAQPASPPLPNGNTPKNNSPPGNSTPSAGKQSPSPDANSSTNSERSRNKSSDTKKLIIVALPVAVFLVVVALVVLLCMRKKRTSQSPSSFVVHPKDPSNPDNLLKIVVANNNDMSSSNLTASGSQSRYSSGTNDTHVVEVGNLIISVQVLRNVTRNFAPENELGRGGFGTVYKGELDDGTAIAVKRMEASVISNKALDEFQAEIAVLSKVRHRHLVSLLGYSIEGNERLLVYEYMPKGALSKHLFQWNVLKLEPLSWKRRLNIALDVARGMEYLHNLAHKSFIHRDLKSSNILLGDDYRAKVADFGLVKLAPDGKSSVATRLAGTFGYLAPEYAEIERGRPRILKNASLIPIAICVLFTQQLNEYFALKAFTGVTSTLLGITGKVTTKADVFSYGVVLMELVTGLVAIDEDRPEEQRYLAEWFWHIKTRKEKLRTAIDPALDVTEETFESICIIAELAGHCTVREASQRPDMGHAVNVLAPLVEKWKPVYDDQEEYLGIDCSQPLHQMVKVWQESDGTDYSLTSLGDSKGSIPPRPDGFAVSFASTDAR
ncbi:hypothetical protein ACLOJK_020803 [Asimina triloba]